MVKFWGMVVLAILGLVEGLTGSGNTIATTFLFDSINEESERRTRK